MVQIKNFCGTNLKLEGKSLAWRILLVLLIYYRTGKAKSPKCLTGWGTNFLLTCGAKFSRQSCSHSKPALLKVSFHEQMERKHSPLNWKMVMKGIMKIVE